MICDGRIIRSHDQTPNNRCAPKKENRFVFTSTLQYKNNVNKHLLLIKSMTFF